MKSIAAIICFCLLAMNAIPGFAADGAELRAREITILPARTFPEAIEIRVSEWIKWESVLPATVSEMDPRSCGRLPRCVLEERGWWVHRKLDLQVGKAAVPEGFYYFVTYDGVEPIAPDFLQATVRTRSPVADVEARLQNGDEPPEGHHVLPQPRSSDIRPYTTHEVYLVALTVMNEVEGGFVLHSPQELQFVTLAAGEQLVDYIGSRSKAGLDAPVCDDDAADFQVRGRLAFEIYPNPTRYVFFAWESPSGSSFSFAIYDDSPAPSKLGHHHFDREYLDWWRVRD